jgi:tryptophanyl-tRNA synthetase
MWLLSCVVGKGLLERATSYKDKVAKGLDASMGLFNYPVLMAADILICRSTLVPVGKDQQQHVEMAQDMAASFNAAFGREVFQRPEWRFSVGARVPGVDGEKMSKSYNNTIEIFEEVKAARKKVMRITTDSRPMEQPKPDFENDHLYQLYSLFATDAQRDEMAALYRRGGFGYGQVKTALADASENYFSAARARRAELAADLPRVEAILADGATRARKKASEVLLRTQKACGIAR